MLDARTDPPAPFDSFLTELQGLRRFTGPPVEFWPALIRNLAGIAGAHRSLLILFDPAQPDRLRKLGEWAEPSHAHPAVPLFHQTLPELVRATAQDGRALRPLEPAGRTLHTPLALAAAVRLPLVGSQEQCIAAFLLPQATDGQARETLLRLALAADVPAAYQTQQAAQQARNDVEKFASVLDLMVQVNSHQRFRAAALAFCNGLATRFQCERVSLGWLQGGFVRLQALSHTERFTRQMAAVQALEILMEEAVDQDEEVVHPAAEDTNVVSRDHAKFAREQNVPHLVTLPVRLDGKAVGAVTCERQAKPFLQVEVEQCRLACDQAARWLGDLKRRDRWFGARWATRLREQCATLVGPEHTWAKVLACLGALALVALFLPIYPYRVEGNFILRSEEVAYLTAPFDGYIRSVQARPGDDLPAGGLLLQLHTEDLELEEAAALADQTRYLREAEKARAAKQLAEMRIAQALADQARARLELVRHRLQQASLRSPFAAVVIEGDLRERLGAPVKQGDALFRVARTDSLYVEAEVNERDLHEILDRPSGEIAFVSQPQRKYPITVVRFEPAAVPKEKENVFLVRGRALNIPETWWRPGMSGVAKFDVEPRTLAWILTHRTVDFLRLLLWW